MSETDEVKKAAAEALNEALDQFENRLPSVDELTHLVDLAGPVLEGDPLVRQLIQIFRRAAADTRSLKHLDESEKMIDEIMDFHEATEYYSTHKSWFDQLYKDLEDAGSSRKDDIELSLRRLTPDQLRHIYNSLPNR